MVPGMFERERRAAEQRRRGWLAATTTSTASAIRPTDREPTSETPRRQPRLLIALSGWARRARSPRPALNRARRVAPSGG